jgi:hypothetical protein
MPDVLSQGGDHDPGPWPRRIAVLAVLAVVVAIGIVHVRPHHPAAPARPAGRVSQAPVAGPGAGPGPPGVGVGGPSVPGQGGQGADHSEPGVADGIVGPTLRWDATVRLPVTGQQPAWFSPGTGGVARIAGLPSDRYGYQFDRLGAGWAIQGDARPQSGCAACAGLPQPVYFLGDHAQSVRPIGVADDSAPAAAPGALWLTAFRPGADLSTAAATAQQVAATGRAIGRPLRLPPGQVVDQGTDHGLLLLTPAAAVHPATGRLWDPATGRLGRAFTGILAASADEIAWTSRCAPTCQVHLLSLATGAEHVIALRAGSSAAGGMFSRDGSFLALAVSFSSGGDSAPAVELEVAAAATGRLTVVPGTWASSDALVSFGWPSAADRLVAELSFTSKVQVASWRPGAAELSVAPVAAGPLPAAVITG